MTSLICKVRAYNLKLIESIFVCEIVRRLPFTSVSAAKASSFRVFSGYPTCGSCMMTGKYFHKHQRESAGRPIYAEVIRYLHSPDPATTCHKVH